MAYSTLQPGLQYFGDPDRGYIAYAVHGRGRVRIALADPIAARDDHPQLVTDFLAAGGPAIFVQCSFGFAETLARLGLRVNRGGTETEIPLQTFDLAGKTKAQLRHWINKARKEGVTVEEVSGAGFPFGELRAVSDAWLATRGHKELFLLTRPMIFQPEPDVRYFVARWDGRITAFIVFDPMYRAGRVVGYYHNHIRFRPDSPTGTTDLLTITAADKFRAEGAETMSLGLSPLAGLGTDEPFPHNRLTRHAFRWVFEHGNRWYPFKNNEFHKKKYAARTVPVFLASNRGMTIADFVAVLRCTGVI